VARRAHALGAGRSKVREQKTQELRWTHRTLPAHVRNNLSPAEQQYFRSYDQLLNKYMRSGRLGVGLDLTVVSAVGGRMHSQMSDFELMLCHLGCLNGPQGCGLLAGAAGASVGCGWRVAGLSPAQ
jgi:hypothetical protein